MEDLAYNSNSMLLNRLQLAGDRYGTFVRSIREPHTSCKCPMCERKFDIGGAKFIHCSCGFSAHRDARSAIVMQCESDLENCEEIQQYILRKWKNCNKKEEFIPKWIEEMMNYVSKRDIEGLSYYLQQQQTRQLLSQIGINLDAFPKRTLYSQDSTTTNVKIDTETTPTISQEISLSNISEFGGGAQTSHVTQILESSLLSTHKECASGGQR